MVIDNDELIVTLKAEIPQWKLHDGYIMRQFVFENFDKAFEFMARVAVICKTENHHPNWTNNYKLVNIQLSTVDEGGITSKDVTLARLIDESIVS